MSYNFNEILNQLQSFRNCYNYEEGIKLCDKLLLTGQNIDTILIHKSYFLYKSEEYEKGLETVDLIKFIDVDYVCAKSMILISQNKFDEALNVIKKHIWKIEKRYLHHILSLSAKILKKKKDYGLAIFRYCNAIYHSPRFDDIFIEMYQKKIYKIGWKISTHCFFPEEFKQEVIVLLFVNNSHLNKFFPNEMIIELFRSLGTLYIPELIINYSIPMLETDFE